VNDPDPISVTPEAPACAMTLMAHAVFCFSMLGGKLGELSKTYRPNAEPTVVELDKRHLAVIILKQK
jgi:hypothetical protein